MLSFIVIGYNEGWKLSKCLESILDTVSSNRIENFEIVYVDSNSTDDSIQRARKFDNVKIFKLTKDVNAAIARNVGVEKSKGDILFFLDGDMELKKDSFSLIYNQEGRLTRDYISGNWMNYFYDKNDIFLNKEKFSNQKEDTVEATTGGLFVLRRETWEKINGMRSMFKKSQDIDLGLRLAKRGIMLLRKKEILANHHTVAYRNKNRIWKELFNGKHLYARSLIYREHIFNKYMYTRLFRNEYSLIILIICSLLSIMIGFHYGFIFYFILILVRSKLKLNILVYFFIRDVMVLFGFLFFHPKRQFDIKVENM